MHMSPYQGRLASECGLLELLRLGHVDIVAKS